jgi:G3E family GTPase
MKTRVVFLEGYLGAGKTTLAYHLARALNEQGRSVSIVTNDQGNVLVDTQFMQNAGVDVREVTGACFCTRFDEFIKNARSLVSVAKPDVLIAEPIGTSTSLLGSVIAPMKSLYKDEFQVSPLFVVVDGQRTLKDLMKRDNLDLVPRRMIPIHQMREGEVLVISKTDLLTDEERTAVRKYVAEQVPDAEIFEFSSVDKRNLAQILGVVNSDLETKKIAPDVDQRLFSMEKAAMGWYSTSCRISADGEKVDIYDVLTSMMKGISKRFDADDIAHVKILVNSTNFGMKISLVGDSLQIDGARGGRYLVGEADFVLNSRIRSLPNPLKQAIEGVVESTLAEAGIRVSDRRMSCFVPKPDAPKYP